MDITRRRFVGAALAAGVWGGSRSCATAADAQERVPPKLKFGAVLTAVRTTAKTRGLKRASGDIEPQEKAAIRLTFPAATVGGQVAEYEICAANAGGSVRAVRICALNGLYPRRHANFAKAVTATVSADALPAGIETVRVTPLDSYGNRGRALEARIGERHG